MVSPVLSGTSALLGDKLSPGGIWVRRAGAQGLLQGQMKMRRVLSQAAPQFLCPEDSGQVSETLSLFTAWCPLQVLLAATSAVPVLCNMNCVYKLHACKCKTTKGGQA